MRLSASALTRACLLLSVSVGAFAQTEPVIIEAESGTLGANLTTATAGTNTYVTTSVSDTTLPTVPRIATHTVTFPAAGNYELYARYLVGPLGPNDDSWYFGQGFGIKEPGVGAQWALQNETNTGFTAPNATVLPGGTAPLQVFKWVKITGSQGPAAWVVPDGALTQTFQWASREDGMQMDKLAFGRAGVCYTVANLDAVQNATGTCPPPPPPEPPPYTRTDPPIATGLDKYLGAAWSPNLASLNFANYWNQVTPENGGKWGSVEGTRDVMNWAQADASRDLANANNFPFKWHTLFWGNQQPGWIESLPPAEQLEEIHEWLAAIRDRYGDDIDQIEVVNEPLHDPPRGATNGNYYDALGGAGATGWDWVITAFTLARQYFPNAELLINDYSITNDGNATTNYLTIINLLKERGLIDAIGDQGHAFSTTEAAPMPNHRANLDRLAATGLPIYITELDIDGNLAGVLNHEVQLAAYQRIFPMFWEHPAVKGVTIWGYVQGNHWRNAQGAWLLYQNGGERPALQWLIKYVGDTPATVTPGQSFAVSEATRSQDPDVATATQFLIDSGFGVNSDSITTATLMLKHPGPFFDAMGFAWVGGLANYDGSNAQAIAFAAQYGAASVGTPIGTLVATDPDAGQTLSWRLESGTAGWFVIDENTGVLKLKPGPDPILDFETTTSITLMVSVWDGYKRSAPQSVTINVINENDNAPAITAGQTWRIDDGYKHIIAAVEVSDPDDINQIGFTTFQDYGIVSGNPRGVFKLREDGELEIEFPRAIDWSRASYLLGAVVGDGENTSAVETISIVIPDVVHVCINDVIDRDVPKQSAAGLLRRGAELGKCKIWE